MKKYIIAAIFSLATAAEALACAFEGPTHNAYVFSVYHRDRMASPFREDMNNWWKRYGGEPESTDWAYYENNADTLRTIAKKRGDKGMLEYMRLLDAYLEVSRNVSMDSWDYPTKQELARRDSTLRQILAEASAYKGRREREQFALMTMRANMMLGRDKANMLYWTSTAAKLPDGVWRDLCRNIYARALLNSGLRRQACEIYAEQGDMQSIAWSMKGYRNMAGIRKVQGENPSSYTLLYLVQDLVNNYQETLDGDYPQGSNNPRRVEAAEAMEFVAFADSVANGGKTPWPCLWESAAAMVAYLMNDGEAAALLADKALRMDGTPRMKDNARCIRLLVRASTMGLGWRETSEWLTEEFRWLDKKIDEEHEAGAHGNHYADVKERIAYNVLAPRYAEAGNLMAAMALYGMMEENDFSLRTLASGKDEHIYTADDYAWNNNYTWSNEYFDMMKSLPADSLAAYYAYLTAAKTDVFEHYVAEQVYADKDYYNDLIGTRYIAEGRFADALKYLERVDVAYLAEQNISWYMANRDYTVERWFARQLPNVPETDGARRGTPTRNMKVEYCNDILRLEAEYNIAAAGAVKDSLSYALAVRYYQASPYGDCWFLTHYGHSVADSARTGELDFAATAARYLDECAASADLTLRYKSLYATASMPFDPWYSESYDSNYDPVYTLRPASFQYNALAALAKFASEHPQYTDNYTTRCDVLRRFQAMTHH